MTSKESFLTTRSSCREILIIQSGISPSVIRENIVEANSDITEEELLEFILLHLKAKKDMTSMLRALKQFIHNKSEYESLGCYKENYDEIFRQLVTLVFFIYENFNNYQAYVNKTLKFNKIKLLETTDILFTTDHE